MLQLRVRRMLHLEADPLDEGSISRPRLRLREGDDAFFRANIMDVSNPHTGEMWVYLVGGLPRGRIGVVYKRKHLHLLTSPPCH